MRESQTSNQECASSEIAADHSLHWLGMLAVTAYAWQLHGAIWALTVLLALIVVISISNLLLLALSGKLALLRVNRWSWIVIAAVALAISGSSTSSV